MRVPAGVCAHSAAANDAVGETAAGGARVVAAGGPWGNVMTPTLFPQVKCPSCGWVHIAVPADYARQEVLVFNRASERGGWGQVAT